MSWLSGWSFRKSHVVNQQAGAGTLYQKLFLVYKGVGVDSGSTVYLGGRCLDDFGDIRFTASDGVTLLDYWIESYVSGISAYIWVEISDDLTAGNVTIYIYYEKSDAITTSNGVNTFLFFEDGDSISEWTGTFGTWSADGVIHQTDDTISTPWGNGLKITSPPAEDGRKVSVNMKIVNTSGNRYMGFSGKWLDADNYLHCEFRKEATPQIRLISYVFGLGWGTQYNVNYDMEYGVFHRLTVGISSGGVVQSWLDNILKHSFTDATWDKTWTNINLHTFNTKGDFDDIFIGKYVSPEPTDGVWGGTEANISLTQTLNVSHSSIFDKIIIFSNVLNMIHSKIVGKLIVLSNTLNIAHSKLIDKIILLSNTLYPNHSLNVSKLEIIVELLVVIDEIDEFINKASQYIPIIIDGTTEYLTRQRRSSVYGISELQGWKYALKLSKNDNTLCTIQVPENFILSGQTVRAYFEEWGDSEPNVTIDKTKMIRTILITGDTTLKVIYRTKSGENRGFMRGGWK